MTLGGASSSGWIELSAPALRHNLGVFRAAAGEGVGLGVVLKAEAYGHGLLGVLSVVHPHVDVLHVVTAADALRIRAWEAEVGATRRRVLVLGVVDRHEVGPLAEHGVEVVLGDRSWERIVGSLEPARTGPLAVHLHLDSGLGREGFTPGEVEGVLGWLGRAPDAVRVVGVMTHFADVEDVTEHQYARGQLKAFDAGARALVDGLSRRGWPTRLEAHTAASAATLVLPDSRREMVRVGIGLYGLWPSRETRLSTRLVSGELPELQPVLTWRCRSQAVRWLTAGSHVGYGCTHRCAADTRIAVLPLGYYDGYPRLVSHRAHVLIGGRRCPVLGRVMMNHVVVDVTDAPDVGEDVVATVIGRDGDEVISADQLAEWSQTISYEVVARLGAHIPRRVVEQATICR